MLTQTHEMVSHTVHYYIFENENTDKIFPNIYSQRKRTYIYIQKKFALYRDEIALYYTRNIGYLLRQQKEVLFKLHHIKLRGCPLLSTIRK